VGGGALSRRENKENKEGHGEELSRVGREEMIWEARREGWRITILSYKNCIIICR